MLNNLVLADFIALVSLAASLTALGKIFFGIAQSMATIQVKVDTMWEFTMRRAKAEIIAKGLGDVNSPIKLTKEAKAMISHNLATSLVQLYHEAKPNNDVDFAILIEQKFGDILLKDVCIPHGVQMGACLILAIDAAKCLLGKSAGDVAI